MPHMPHMPHKSVKHSTQHEHNITHMEVGQHHTYPKAKQRHKQGYFSVIAKAVEKCLPFITNNIPNTTSQNGYRTQHSTTTALHITINTIAKSFNAIVE